MADRFERCGNCSFFFSRMRLCWKKGERSDPDDCCESFERW